VRLSRAIGFVAVAPVDVFFNEVWGRNIRGRSCVEGERRETATVESWR
jgi:hypothetical protein